MIQVSTNGYISLEDPPKYETLPNFPLPDSDMMIVAPFAAHIDTTRGRVSCTSFLESYRYDSQLDDVSDFIESNYDDSFTGGRMMVAEWYNVPKYGGSTVSCVFGCTLTWELILNLHWLQQLCL